MDVADCAGEFNQVRILVADCLAAEETAAYTPSHPRALPRLSVSAALSCAAKDMSWSLTARLRQTPQPTRASAGCRAMSPSKLGAGGLDLSVTGQRLIRMGLFDARPAAASAAA